MRKMRKLFVAVTIVMAIIGTGPVFASGDQESVEAENAEAEQLFVSIAANPIGGSSYRMGATMADVLNREYGDSLQVVAEETNGYMENITLVADGDVEVAFSNNMQLEYGFHAAEFFDGYPAGKATAIMALAANVFHIIVQEDSPVQSLSDIEGLRVGLGQPGGSSLIDAEYLMDVVGIDPDTDITPYRVKAAEQRDMFLNGMLDVYIWNGKLPNSGAQQLATQRDVRFISLEDEVTDGMIEISEIYGSYSIPAGYYQDQAEEVSTVGNTTILAANVDVSEDAIYYFTKGLLENLDELIERDAAFAKIKLEDILNGITVPLHPGALRYYEEIELPGLEEFKAKYQNVEPR